MSPPNPQKQKKEKQSFRAYREVGKFFSGHMHAYGGVGALLKSPYLHVSVVFTAALWPIWTKEGWWDLILTTHPSILGFTLGGFALILATATDRFGAILSKARVVDGSELDTPLAKLGAAFVHFLLLQFASIALAILAKSCWQVPAPSWAKWLSNDWVVNAFWAVSAFIGFYSLILAVATTQWTFTILLKLVKFHKIVHKRGNKIQEPEE